MKIVIASPTFKRAGTADTFKYLKSVAIFAHAFEVEAYRKAYPHHHVVSMSDSMRKNLPKVRNFINDYFKGADAVLQVDDDLSHVAYWHDRKRIRMDEAELREFVLKYTVMAGELGAMLWGVNVNCDKQCYREYTPFSLTSYISASFSCFLKGNDLRYDERFHLKEDYDMTIQQVNLYRKVLRVNRAYYIKKSLSNSGGCTVYRNTQEETDQFLLLQKKWGSTIVKGESLGGSRNHRSTKVRTFDVNPVLHIPIRGI